MDKELKDTTGSIRKWSLGGLLALGAVLVILVVRIENIPVIERRLQNKIEIQEEHEEELQQHHLDFLMFQLAEKDEVIQELKEKHKHEIQNLKEYYELKIELEIIRAKQ